MCAGLFNALRSRATANMGLAIGKLGLLTLGAKREDWE